MKADFVESEGLERTYFGPWPQLPQVPNGLANSHAKINFDS